MVILQALEVIVLAIIAILLVRVGIVVHWSRKINDRNIEETKQMQNKWEQATEDLFSVW